MSQQNNPLTNDDMTMFDFASFMGSSNLILANIEDFVLKHPLMEANPHIAEKMKAAHKLLVEVSDETNAVCERIYSGCFENDTPQKGMLN